MFSKISSGIALAAMFVGLSSCITDYCGQGLCSQTGFRHVTCDVKEKFLQSCPSDARTIQFTYSNIQQILDLHNKLRNKIAGGNESNFNAAAKMNTLVSKATVIEVLKILKS